MMLIQNSFNSRRPSPEIIVSSNANQAVDAKQTAARAVSKELRKLLCAAAVSVDFCQRLLTTPGQALESGYNGETFELTPRERALVLSLQASSLADFAHQLLDQLGSNPYQQENGLYHDAMYRAVPSGD
jgi:hypothetical protein